MLRIGAPYRGIPARCGTWGTFSTRFRRWQKQGIRQKALQAEAEQSGQLDWDVTALDGSYIKAYTIWIEPENVDPMTGVETPSV